jgi:hypothetical protein
VSAGEKDLDKEIAYLLALAKESNDFAKDPYFLGLVAATLYQVRVPDPEFAVVCFTALNH